VVNPRKYPTKKTNKSKSYWGLKTTYNMPHNARKIGPTKPQLSITEYLMVNTVLEFI